MTPKNLVMTLRKTCDGHGRHYTHFLLEQQNYNTLLPQKHQVTLLKHSCVCKYRMNPPAIWRGFRFVEDYAREPRRSVVLKHQTLDHRGALRYPLNGFTDVPRSRWLPRPSPCPQWMNLKPKRRKMTKKM